GFRGSVFQWWPLRTWGGGRAGRAGGGERGGGALGGGAGGSRRAGVRADAGSGGVAERSRRGGDPTLRAQPVMVAVDVFVVVVARSEERRGGNEGWCWW